jgi:hypothetical protein
MWGELVRSEGRAMMMRQSLGLERRGSYVKDQNGGTKDLSRSDDLKSGKTNAKFSFIYFHSHFF